MMNYRCHRVHGDLARACMTLALYLSPQLWVPPALASNRPTTSSTCPSTCIEISDYESRTTALHYSRSRSFDSNAHQGAMPSRWRHEYEIRLTRDGDDRVIFDRYGQAHRFQRQADGSYLGADATSGSLSENDGAAVWANASGVQIEFQGSYPTRLNFPDEQSLRLDYEAGRLRSIRDDQGEQIVIEHDDGLPSRVHLPDGGIIEMDSDPCSTLPEDLASDATDDPEPCDTQANPVPGFDTISTPSGVTTLDARPASCQSYFVDYYGTVRGEEIETGIAPLPPYADMMPSNRSFPIVDFIHGDELVVVRSRDLASPSFNNPDDPNALHERLMRDGAQIQSRFLDPLQRDGVVSRTEQGRTTHIVQNPSQFLSLHVLIRQDMASPDHWRQIEQARQELLQRYGIHLQIVIIP